MSSGLQVDVECMKHPRKPNVVLMKDVHLRVVPGSFVSFVGPSGAGKSTLLRIIAGLERRSGGEVFWNGEKLRGPSRAIQLVFQDYRLLPWKNVEDNLRFAAPRSSKEEVTKLLEDVLVATGLTKLRKNWPKNLSGGETARVAFARAFVDPPGVLLLDEPFTGLDIVSRQELQQTLTSTTVAKGTTVILVSHSVDDAIFLSDTVHVVGKEPFTILHTCEIPIARGNRDRYDPVLQNCARDVVNRLLRIPTANENTGSGVVLSPADTLRTEKVAV